MDIKKLKVSFVGAGNTCKVIGKLLKEKGYNIEGIASKRLESARIAGKFIGVKDISDKPAKFTANSDIVFITTPDDYIKTVAGNNVFKKNSIILHCSGNYSSQILKNVIASDISVASLHPLRSLANPEIVVKNFNGTFCTYEGDKKAARIVEKMIKNIGGIPLQLKTSKKSLYHIGAVFASNYLVAIFEIALQLFEEAGIQRNNGVKALLKLSKGTIANIENVGIPKALTGPIERGDIKTISNHLKALKNKNLAQLYRALGKVAIDIAVAKGSITKQKANYLRKLL